MFDEKYNELCRIVIDHSQKMIDSETNALNLRIQLYEAIREIDYDLPLQIHQIIKSLDAENVNYRENIKRYEERKMEWEEKLKLGRKPYAKIQLESLISNLTQSLKQASDREGLIEYQIREVRNGDGRFRSFDGMRYAQRELQELKDSIYKKKLMLQHLTSEYNKQFAE